MSTLPNRPLSIEAKRIGEVVAAVGLMPAGVQGAVRSMVYDLLSHHRLGVGAHVGRQWPGRRGAQKMWFTRSFRYTKPTSHTDIAGIVGEGFVAAQSGNVFPDIFRHTESGAAINTREWMAIPTMDGQRLPRGEFQKILAGTAGARTALVKGRGGRILIVRETPGRGRGRTGARSIVLGILSRQRRQRPILGYYAKFDDVARRHLPKFERALDLAQTAAGRAALVERQREASDARAIYQATLAKYLAAHPGRLAEARRVAGAAAREAKKMDLAKE